MSAIEYFLPLNFFLISVMQVFEGFLIALALHLAPVHQFYTIHMYKFIQTYAATVARIASFIFIKIVLVV